jgi:carbon monoxide dehydrogenase subunit G
MARIAVYQRVESPIAQVWPVLADLETHADWMREAESLVFTSPTHRGVGTTMEVRTRVGPFRTNDIIEVTSWEEGRAIGVAHRGLVSGEGELSLTEDGEETLVSWVESLRFPWWLGGPVTAWVAKPVLALIWRGNLKRFAGLVGGS